jgi:hypothetical protein
VESGDRSCAVAGAREATAKNESEAKTEDFAFLSGEANCSLAKTFIDREETTESEKARRPAVSAILESVEVLAS